MNELAPTHNNTETIKYMPLGRVNGHYVNMRARYLDEMEHQRQDMLIRNALMLMAGVLMTAGTVISVLYFLA